LRLYPTGKPHSTFAVASVHVLTRYLLVLHTGMCFLEDSEPLRSTVGLVSPFLAGILPPNCLGMPLLCAEVRIKVIYLVLWRTVCCVEAGSTRGYGGTDSSDALEPAAQISCSQCPALCFGLEKRTDPKAGRRAVRDGDWPPGIARTPTPDPCLWSWTARLQGPI
jgi:hypothetical protein